jgi:hypothetical protein
MGRTIHKFRDDDDERRGKVSKGAKHSRNIPGKGMRVINNWLEEEYEEYDDSDDLDYEYDANNTQTQRYKGKHNGY